MKLIIALVAIASGTVILKILLAQSYNLLFLLAARPGIWMALMPILGFVPFPLAKAMGLGVSVPWWSVTLALATSWPRWAASSRLPASGAKEIDEAFYEGAGIQSGRTKQRVGFILFGIGALVGYLLAYATRYTPVAPQL